MNGIVNETFSNTWCHPTKWLAKTLGKKSHFTLWKSLPKNPWTGLVVRNVEPCAGRRQRFLRMLPKKRCQCASHWVLSAIELVGLNGRHRRMSPRTARILSSECHSTFWPSSKLSPGMYDIYVA